MSAVRDLVGDDRDNRSHQEIMIGLLQVLVDSQTKQAESHAITLHQIATTQHQMMEILRSSTSYKIDEEKHKVVEKPSLSSQNQPASTIIDEEELQSDEEGGQVVSEYVLDEYAQLYQAAVDGVWDDAKMFLEENPEAISKAVTRDLETVLDIALGYMVELTFIEEIVKLMPPEALENKTVHGYTPLHRAAINGYAKAAELIVTKNPKTTQILSDEGEWENIPLGYAVNTFTVGQKETVEYLYSVTRHENPSPFSGYRGAVLLCDTVDAGFNGIQLNVDSTYDHNTQAKDGKHQSNSLEVIRSSKKELIESLDGINGDEENPLENYEDSNTNQENASHTSDNRERDNAEPSESSSVSISSNQGTLIKLISAYLMPSIKQVPCFKQIYEQLYNKKVMHKQAYELVECMLTQLDKRMNRKEVEAFFEASRVMKKAIKQGTIEFVKECINTFPLLIWCTMGEQSMLQMAIAERNEMIVDLICDSSEDVKSDLISRDDKNFNTILHYAAKLAPSDQLNSISGAYLQMQRELQWFKGVENMMLEKNKFQRNVDGDTAQHIFTEEHKELMEKGEKQLKDTSGSCMVVAALIATVAFAAAFTAPGGNISDSNSTKNGTPIFLDRTSFTVFAVADATALFSSVTSVLMFLAIYTSRYAEVDFLKSLPQKLIVGLITLFISMATILVAFGASMYIVLGGRYSWAAIPIAVFSCVPMILFASLQLPLFFEMVRFTYWNSPLQKHRYIPNQQLSTKKDN